MSIKVEQLISDINERLKELRKIIYRSEMLEIYELYHGNELIMVGTLKQISEYTGHVESTLKNYSYPGYLQKTKNSKTATRLIKVGDYHA